jgi:tripartite-type tricarboxylate transporter receptor subunit TctC
LNADGSDVTAGTPQEFGAYIKSELAKWTKVAKAANLKFQ